VAALAGVPKDVIQRARKRLAELEEAAQRHAEQHQAQLPLFENRAESPVLETLRGLEPDELTPRQALEQLYRLKQQLNET
jgi:DNA mismatch repair protein MutS